MFVTLHPTLQGAYSILRPGPISWGRALIFTGVRSISESLALVVGVFTPLRGVMLYIFRGVALYFQGFCSTLQGAYSILRPGPISWGRALIFTGVRSISESFVLVVGVFTLPRGVVLYIFRGLALYFKGFCPVFQGVCFIFQWSFRY